MKSLNQYHDIISLGSSCQTSYQLRRMKLRKESGPFDWFISASVPGIVKLFHNQFQYYMEFDQLQLIGKAQQHFIVRDTRYIIDSYHDFPFTQHENLWNQEYAAFKQKIERRAERFLNTLAQSPSIVLVRTQMTKEAALQLHQAIKPWIGTSDYCLLAVNNHEDSARTDVVSDDWGLEHIKAARIPKGEDWRGADAAWARLFDKPW
ncbi:DUF1796 family putative cysteine peptidase [Paenibacillus wynnii]|uniref:DUF1796 family putative cysteine peptidase n=1 Tax=Paenibacillus wynnii TaxID=268407 RepID=UPI00278E018A|nr:DUF1796 family putative cysteine peptidase [Paenibacillus wynnii]MDQ0192414.1 hypothetical protein [Paenibacillus wynnii]